MVDMNEQNLEETKTVSTEVAFFLVVTPGLEELAKSELLAKWRLLNAIDSEFFPGLPVPEISKGGVLFRCPKGAGWTLNHYLKIPTRILQRLDHSRVRDFPNLYKRLSKIRWNEYFRNGPIDVKVSASGSRLKIKDRIKETAIAALDHAKSHQAFRKEFLQITQTIYVRLEGNALELSLDTSGDALYLRGYKPYSSEAPLRESLASALYWACLSQMKQLPKTVIDPMCGSGTLIFEALGFWSSIRTRKFAYENFPQAPSLATFDIKKNLQGQSPQAGFGFDQDQKAIEASVNNASQFVEKKVGARPVFTLGPIETLQRSWPEGSLLILLNPPYNERIKADQKELAQSLVQFFSKMRPATVGIFWPGELPFEFSRLKVLASYRTRHGGLAVTMSVLAYDE
jgi:putative N6-adenine-specific DNA methylase